MSGGPASGPALSGRGLQRGPEGGRRRARRLHQERAEAAAADRHAERAGIERIPVEIEDDVEVARGPEVERQFPVVSQFRAAAGECGYLRDHPVRAGRPGHGEAEEHGAALSAGLPVLTQARYLKVGSGRQTSTPLCEEMDRLAV